MPQIIKQILFFILTIGLISFALLAGLFIVAVAGIAIFGFIVYRKIRSKFCPPKQNQESNIIDVEFEIIDDK